jgi:hypothetical protein
MPRASNETTKDTSEELFVKYEEVSSIIRRNIISEYQSNGLLQQ